MPVRASAQASSLISSVYTRVDNKLDLLDRGRLEQQLFLRGLLRSKCAGSVESPDGTFSVSPDGVVVFCENEARDGPNRRRWRSTAPRRHSTQDIMVYQLGSCLSGSEVEG
uniref:Uncharacterized protein n=1 Tax=Chromera velia CCMP2878 TaxID=1169474 RepID=A0A0G4IFD0_9ALVE|eukprot:Cvel_2484.t1-p1 / transcript=Cvel_2484.t1 / gene=Cvel_2484 / organism=Chromera_velia_CCMP2878 / gene_product=hypothetical protein / transcript_product=hypothetical protein / location=Cvel_scaffold97:116274-117331(+) / protein_length=110 / sequence_SO=supercontig / SO=protein_coding / is_pseudo=false